MPGRLVDLADQHAEVKGLAHIAIATGGLGHCTVLQAGPEVIMMTGTWP